MFLLSFCLEYIFASLSQGRETQRAVFAMPHPQGPSLPRAPAEWGRGDTRSAAPTALVPCAGPALLRGSALTTSPTEQYHRRAYRQEMLCAGPPCLGKFLLPGHEKAGSNISLWYRAFLRAGHQHTGFACSGIQELFSQYLSQYLSQPSLGQHWNKWCSLSPGPETQGY